MNSRLPAFGLFLFASLAGCSSMSVNYDYNHETDFRQYQTYDWIERPAQLVSGHLAQNPLSYQRAVNAAELTLEAKGFRKDTRNPEMLIAVHGNVEDRVDVRNWNYHYGYWGPWYGGGVEVNQWTEGTLILDIVSAESHELIWRGWASAAMDPGQSGQGEKITQAVGRILENFPPPQ